MLCAGLAAFCLALIARTFAAPGDLTPPSIDAPSYVLVDFYSGEALAELNADQPLAPASLTKIMTAYVVFRELGAGKIQLSDLVSVSETAWRTEGSRTFIEVNTQVPVEDLLKGMIVQSGNDASVALAEYVSGTEAAFAELMNAQAKRLGMTNSHFMNSTGLPHPEHYSSARDIARVARALILEFPELYRWYSLREFTYNKITQHNRNRLLGQDPSVDGMKTGHTKAAGYCLVTSARREGMRLISVVMGSKSPKARVKESQALLNFGFRSFETHRLYRAGDPLVQARIWKGSANRVPLGLKHDLHVTIPRKQYGDLSARLLIDASIVAPVLKGSEFGTVEVKLGEQAAAAAPVVALQDVPEGNLWQRLVDEALLLWFE
jgi:D-alanyl-D-alanine carboxypeptidase (penicillin-binding protein 5/6)